MKKIGIIGPGLLGGAFAHLLKKRGFEIAGIYGRRREAAEVLAKEVGSVAVEEPGSLLHTADIIFLCVSDSAIREMADRLSETGGIMFETGGIMSETGGIVSETVGTVSERAGIDRTKVRSKYIYHFSGALPSSVLTGAKKLGLGIGSIHPLQSFVDRDTALRMIPSSVFAIEGEREALDAARSLLSKLGVGRIVEISADDKPLYHAAAAIACNYLVLLGGIAVDIMKSIGIPEEEGLCGIAALMEGTLGNLKKAGIPGCLTGPVSRGDTDTVALHLEALKGWRPDIAELYAAMGRLLLPIAEMKGSIPIEKIKELNRLLRED